MFLRPKDRPWMVDAVVAVEARIKFHPQINKEPDGELLIMYVNSKNGMSFGTCPMQAHLFSAETRKALSAFLLAAEADFGRLMFTSGASEGLRGELDQAESDEPLTGLGDT